MSDKTLEELFKEEAERHGLGATGYYPHGCLGPADGGELRAGVSIVDDKIVINFGKSTSWVALDAEGARKFAAILLKHAKMIDGKD